MKTSSQLLPAVPMVGVIRYDETDHSIEFTPSDSVAVSSYMREGVVRLTIDTLEVVVTTTDARLLFVEGYYPRFSWRPQRLPQRVVRPGIVLLDLAAIRQVDTIARLNDASHWTPYYDRERRVLEISDASLPSDVKCIEFSTSQAALIADDVLVGLQITLI